LKILLINTNVINLSVTLNPIITVGNQIYLEVARGNARGGGRLYFLTKKTLSLT
jgi:hypothetical protein